jgi:deoxyribodipyrimidine photo-lyase
MPLKAAPRAIALPVMKDTMTPMFPPTRTAALERLRDFAPHAGRAYAGGRNHDPGPGGAHHVSRLSPYIRHRLLSEEEVLRTVLGRHSAQAAEKFVQEVLWRTYWKGWLEMRPAVWAQYQVGLRRALDAVQTQSGLRREWEAACTGNTGIACFDAWARELVETGYLHNHTRMWFSSIWIFTLRLPWELGADFFLRHLLDGDPASNTLGWRWVGGIQTPGKTYLARPDNIAAYTGGRFRPAPDDLAQHAPPLDAPPSPERRILPPPPAADMTRPSVLILHEEDLDPSWILSQGLRPLATLVLPPATGHSPLTMAPQVLAFRAGLIDDAVTRWSDKLGVVTHASPDLDIAQWAHGLGADQIITAHAPTGPVSDHLAKVHDLPLIRLQRPYDSRAWPHATAGFFKFRKETPNLLGAMGL